MLLHYVAMRYYANPENPLLRSADYARRSLRGAKGGFTRVEIPAGDADPIRWLAGRTQRPRFYWSGRDGDLEIAAAGASDFTTDLASLEASELRYYGGGAFDPERPASPEWKAFGDSGFFLPRLEMIREGDRSTLALNLSPGEGVGLPDIPGILAVSSAESPELPFPVVRSQTPNLTQWRQNIAEILRSLKAGPLEKIVLARRVDIGFSSSVNALLLMENLRDLTPDSFHFYLEPPGGGAFLGASPELLVSRRGRSLRSEAVAGTRPRGGSAGEDMRLRKELLSSEKDLREQRCVRKHIDHSLRGICEDLHVDSVTEMRLARRRHLVSRAHGELRQGVRDSDILALLHPTPAVGGSPSASALQMIRDLEPFDRGRYAGPVGWLGADGMELAVGIRSALVQNEVVSLYSGAGIVAGSEPQAEWEEIGQKIAEFEKILGIVS